MPTDICHLGPGACCADTAHAGELSGQGVVEAQGKRDRFDQAVGFGWMVLGLNADAAQVLVVATIAALYLGARANFDPTIGLARLLYAFEAVIIGGLGSLWGTLAGGMVIGVAQALGAAINPEWQILAGHIAFVIVLLVRPRGLFPRAND